MTKRLKKLNSKRRKLKRLLYKRGKDVILLVILILVGVQACTNNNLQSFDLAEVTRLRGWAEQCHGQDKNPKCAVFFEAPPVYPVLTRN